MSKAAADTQFDDAPVEKRALTLHNLTWEVSEEEIAEFFAGYHYIPKSLRWQVNKEGNKTGLAAVMFRSSTDAGCAFNHKQQQEIGGQRILLGVLEDEDYEAFKRFDPQSKNGLCDYGVS